MHLGPKLQVKVKCTPVETLRLWTGRMAHRGSRGIALLFHDQRHYKGVRGQHHARPLYPWERPGTHCTGDWVDPRAGTDRCGKPRPPPGFDPRTERLKLALENVQNNSQDISPTVGWKMPSVFVLKSHKTVSCVSYGRDTSHCHFWLSSTTRIHTNDIIVPIYY